jgi:RHS repeat-associated protein
MRWMATVCCVLASLLAPFAAAAATPSELRAQSLARLLDTQQVDGRWDAGAWGLDILATTEALEALRLAGMAASPQYRTGVAWLSAQKAHSVDAAARRITALSAAGLTTVEARARLEAMENPAFDGWGAYAGDAPSVMDTALALAAIIDSLPASDTLARVQSQAGLLLGQQRADGGFPWASSTVSSQSAIVPTARSVLALQRMVGRLTVTTPLASAVSWLRARQKADGSFGVTATGTLVETLEAVRALVAVAGATDPAVTAARQWLALQPITALSPAVVAAMATASDSSLLADADGDGWPDAVEVLRGTNATVADASLAGSRNGRSVTGVTTARLFATTELGASFSQQIAFPAPTGQAVFNLTSGALPDGLSLAADGRVSGRATRLGRFTFTYSAQDAAARQQGEVLVMEVTPATGAEEPVQVPVPAWGLVMLTLLLTAFALRWPRLRGVAMLAAVGLLAIGAAPEALAEHRDVAPLPDEVYERVVLRAGVGGDDLPQRIEGAITALAQLADRVEAREGDAAGTLASRLTGEAGQLEELVSSRMQDRRGRFARAARRDGMKETDALQAALGDRFRSYRRLVRRLEEAGTPAERTAAVKAAREAIETWREPARAHEQLRRITPTLQQATPRSEPSGAVTRREPAYLTQQWPSAGASRFVQVALPAPVAPGAAACGFTSEDVAADGQDVIIDQEIRDLAASLDHSPARIFEWVVNHIEFEPYWGALKGGKGALVSGRANSTDHASLLIALLRASNVPARYVKGQVRWNLTDERLQNWLAVRDGVSAGARLSANGIHAVAYSGSPDGSSPARLLHEHVWVEACVPLDGYRGGALSHAGYRWAPLDASFKQHTYQPGVDVNYSFDFDAFLAERSNGPDSLVGELHSRGVEALARLSQPTLSIADVPYVGVQRPVRLDVLPVALPYLVEEHLEWAPGGSAETAVLPVAHHMGLRLTLLNGGGAALMDPLTFSLVETALARVTLSFEGDSGNLAALSAWRSSTEQDALLPCDIDIRVVPQVMLEGVNKAVGTGVSVPLCSRDSELTIERIEADPEAASSGRGNAHSVRVAASDIQAIFVYAKQSSDRWLGERADDLLSAVRANPAGPGSNLDSIQGAFLELVGLKWFRYVDDMGHQIGRQRKQTGDSGFHIGRTYASAQVVYAFDLPYGLARKGWVIDMVSRSTSTPLEESSTTDGQWEFSRIFGLALSQLESYIWQETARTDAVSTVRGLQYANEKSVETGGTVTLTQANVASAIGQLLTQAANASDGYSTSEISRIRSLVEGGATVRVPRKRLTYVAEGNEWRGTVLLSEQRDTDPTTPGDQIFNAYEITEDLNGGYARFNPASYLSIPRIDFSSILSKSITAWLGFVPATPAPLYTPPTREPLPPPPVLPTVTPAAPARLSSVITKGFSQFITLAGDPVNMVTGNYVHNEVDFHLKGRGGFPIVLERTYNSMDAKDGPFGFGWTHSFNHQLAFLDDDSDGISSETEDGDGITSTLVWTDGTGGERFIKVTGSSASGLAAATFTPPQGFYFATQRQASGTYTIREKNGLTYTFEARDGRSSDLPARLLAVADRNGNTLTLTYNANEELATVTDGLGRALSFTHTGGRITRVCDWSNRCREYEYDPVTADLTEARSPLAVAGQVEPTRYRYYTAADGGNIDHAMREVRQPSGETMTFEYYLNGRVFRHRNALGETSTFRYNDFRRETVQISERGYERRFFFDALGNPLKIIEENGAEHRYAYDDSRDPYLRTKSVDPLGQETLYAYDAQGNLITETLPSRATSASVRDTITYSDFNVFAQPQKVKDARNYRTVFKYDSHGNTTDVIRVNSTGVNPSLPWATPAANQVASWTKRSFDAYGNVLTERQVRDFNNPATGPLMEYGYDDALNGVAGLNVVSLTRRADRDGDGDVEADEVDVATQAFDALGRMTRGLGPDWYQVEYEYDANDRVVAATDALGNLRRFRFDGSGKLVQERLEGTREGVASLEDSRSIEYDRAGRAFRVVTHDGAVAFSRFDAMGNVVEATDADGYSLGFRYDAGNHWVAAWDKLGREVSRRVDVAGRVRSVTDASGYTVSYGYFGPERAGALKSITSPMSAPAGNQVTSFEVDAHGQVIKETETSATNEVRERYRSYDALGRLVREAGPTFTDLTVSGSPLRRQVTKYQFDGLGRPVRVEAGYCTASASGCSGGDTLSTVVRFAHDELGRVISEFRRETSSIEREWRYTHDIHGNVLTATDAKGQVTTYTWGYGHQLERSVAQGGHTTRFERNALGQPVEVSSPEVTYAYAYDAGHRLASVTDSRGGKQLRYRWSAGGLLDARTDGEGGETVYRRDAVGRLTAMALPGGETWRWVRDESGRLSELSSTAGVKRSYAWAADGRLAHLATSAGGSRLSEHAYEYDGHGRRVVVRDTLIDRRVSWQYGYDGRDMLVSAGALQGEPGSETLVPQRSWVFDAWGDLWRETDGTGGSFRQYGYNPGGQLQWVASYQGGSGQLASLALLDYDENGALLGKADTGAGVELRLGWDARGRLEQADTRLIQGGAVLSTETYGYDGLGRRVWKRSAGVVRDNLYDGADILSEYTGGDWSTPSMRYVHGAGTDEVLERIAQVNGVAQAAEYYAADGLGSVVALAKADGSGLRGTLRNAWGSRDALTAPEGALPVGYGYTGREHDATGLVYYRARYYDGSALGVHVGRFVSRDPLGIQAGINDYAYVGNNPVNATDPSGLIARRVSNAATQMVSYAGSAAFNTVFPAARAAPGDPYRSRADALQAVARDIVDSPGAARWEYSFLTYQRTDDQYSYTPPRTDFKNLEVHTRPSDLPNAGTYRSHSVAEGHSHIPSAIPGFSAQDDRGLLDRQLYEIQRGGGSHVIEHLIELSSGTIYQRELENLGDSPSISVIGKFAVPQELKNERPPGPLMISPGGVIR